MRLVARLDWQALGWGTPLAAAQARGAFDRESVNVQAGALATARTDIRPALLEAILAEAPAALRPAWNRLGSAGARAVVTGQQPGCAGGPLLALYKAATAVALAQRLERTLDRPVVPIFWNATDDADFDEIATVGYPSADGSIAYLELQPAARRAAGWVGDVPAAADAAAAEAALHLAGTVAAARLAPFLPATSADHGTWVALFLARIFPSLAILDARSPALRQHAAFLFERYIDRRDAVVEAVTAAGADLEARGYTRTLDSTAAQQALFLTHDRRRTKLAGDLGPLRQALATSPSHLSPNVVLRPLVQDALLPTLVQVVGPAEVGYLLELRQARSVLGIVEPAFVSRLGATLVPESGWSVATELGLEPAMILGDPETTWREAARRDGAAVPRALATTIATLRRELDSAGLEPASVTRLARRFESWRGELESEFEAGARAQLRQRHPELAALVNLLRPRGRAQERILAGMWLCAAWGAQTGAQLVAMADTHLDDLEHGRTTHSVVTL